MLGIAILGRLISRHQWQSARLFMRPSMCTLSAFPCCHQLLYLGLEVKLHGEVATRFFGEETERIELLVVQPILLVRIVLCHHGISRSHHAVATLNRGSQAGFRAPNKNPQTFVRSYMHARPGAADTSFTSAHQKHQHRSFPQRLKVPEVWCVVVIALTADAHTRNKQCELDRM